MKARLGDAVKKGQLLLRVQSNDVSGAYQSYRKAVDDELLARLNLQRQKILYEKGAVAKSALEQAEDVAKNAQADLDAATEQLKVLGVDKDHPSGIVDIRAPISGVITDQQITNASGVQGLGSPNPFTISDLSYVWIICDVYENDLDAVHVGEFADIRLSAYPNTSFQGADRQHSARCSIPTIRTAKVRIEVRESRNDARGHVCHRDVSWQAGRRRTRRCLRLQFLHLHDREWVYAPRGTGISGALEVITGKMLPNNLQEVVSGVKPGDRVVSQRAGAAEHGGAIDDSSESLILR